MGYTLIDDGVGDAPAPKPGRYRLIDEGAEETPAPANSNLKGSSLGGLVMGLRDPIDAGAQLLVRALPDSVVRAGNALNNKLADLGFPVARLDTTADGGTLPGIVAGAQANPAAPVDRMVQAANAEYDASRKAAGRDGIDLARIAGNIANPINRIIPMAGAASTLGVAGRAAAQGAISGAMTPVTDADNFAGSKAAQVGLGAATGGVGGAIADKVAGAAGNALARLKATPAGQFFTASANAIDQQASDALAAAAKQSGFDLSAIPAPILDKARQQVAQALASGQKIDAAALLRKADFDAVGMNPTLGQITRDPTQFTREMNLRGVEGAGEPLAQRFNGQNNALINLLNKAGAEGAPGEMGTGNALVGALGSLDSRMKGAVDAAYQKARDNVGRAAPMDPQAFSTSANLALDEGMLGHYLPTQVRNIMNDVATGKIPFNVQTAVQIDSVLSAAQRSGNQAEAKAIGVVRDALNKAPIADNVGQDTKAAFDAARGLAKARFGTLENVPALDAVVNKGAQPDNFFSKYVLGGTVKDVSGLKEALGPQELGAVRAQIVDYLKSKALNGATDEIGKFSQSAYNKAVSQLGDKLAVFFSPQEIAQLQRVGRVASYIQAAPAGSAVNSSNTAAATMNMLSKLGGKVGGMPWISDFLVKPVQNFADRRAIGNALAAQVAAESVPGANNALRPYLVPLAGGLGAAAASLAK